MKKLIATLLLAISLVSICKADSPLTSTNFAEAYNDHPMVAMAASIQPGEFLPTVLLDFLSDKKSPVDVRLAVINQLGWRFEGNNCFDQYCQYLMKRHKAKNADKLVKKLDGETLAVLAYSKAMSNYFEVAQASEWGHKAVKKDKGHSFSVAMASALIDAQIYLDSNWAMVYKVVADVAHDGALKLDMRQSAIDIIMEYINLYKEY